VNHFQDQSDSNAASHLRVERIRELAAKLLDSTVLNTQKSRANCREYMGAMTQLLDEEDAFHQAPPVELPISVAVSLPAPIPAPATFTPLPVAAASAPRPRASERTVVGAAV
jgi:hypothetical protein